MVSRLVDEIGDGTFPTPIEVLNGGLGVLQKNIRMGYRAKILVEATENLLSKDLITEDGSGNEESIGYCLKGFGNSVRACFLVIGSIS